LVPGPPGEAFAHEVASEVNRESYLLLLWFVKKGSPRWDINAIAAKTSFITPRRFNDLILPVRGASSRPYVPSQAVRHGWTYNVAMFVFPATRVDGTPVLAGLSDQVEVRTEIDGRAVVLRFDPSRSGLDSIDRLTRRR
jgi:hypothetical protein